MLAIGFGYDGDYLDDFFLLDLRTGASCPLVSEDRVTGAEAAVQDDNILVCGGYHVDGNRASSDCVYYHR